MGGLIEEVVKLAIQNKRWRNILYYKHDVPIYQGHTVPNNTVYWLVIHDAARRARQDNKDQLADMLDFNVEGCEKEISSRLSIAYVAEELLESSLAIGFILNRLSGITPYMHEVFLCMCNRIIKEFNESNDEGLYSLLVKIQSFIDEFEDQL